MRHEVTNPHDKITIDCTNVKAAQGAVLIVGNGAYGIANGIMPIFLMGMGANSWFQKAYQMDVPDFLDSLQPLEVAEALESMRLEGNQSSLSDPVTMAHEYAKMIRDKQAEATE